jgi:hypothetical protein
MRNHHLIEESEESNFAPNLSNEAFEWWNRMDSSGHIKLSTAARDCRYASVREAQQGCWGFMNSQS